MFHVIAINERTRRKVYLTATPVTHAEGCTILRKFTPRPCIRGQLEPSASGWTSPTGFLAYSGVTRG